MKKLIHWAGLLCVAAGLAQAPAAAAGRTGKVTLNFVNADIAEVLRAATDLTGRNFLIDPRVKGTITIHSQQPVSRARAYEILLTALRMQGFAAVENGGLVRIVPEPDARAQSLPAPAGVEAPNRVVTRVYPLQHETAASLLPALKPLVSSNNALSAIPARNALVITDYADNVARLERIIQSMDRPARNSLTVIALQHASAIDLAQSIARLMGEPATAGADGGARFAIYPDARTNSLMVSSDQPGKIARVRELAAQLDVATPASGNIHVVYLRNADATQLAKTLRGIVAGGAGASDEPPASPPAQQPALGQRTGPAAAANTRDAAPGAASASASAGQQGNVRIQADAATNSIIITAPEYIYNSLREAIAKLDTRRAQVYVEALIAEVTADRLAQFGIQWQGAGGVGTHGGAAFAGTNFGVRGAGSNILDTQSQPGAQGAGLSVGLLRGQLTLPGSTVPVPALSVLAQALASDKRVNILSTPNLLTLDNEEAQIVIGENVPFVTGSYAQTGATGTTTINPFQTYDRKDVGLTLKVRPQVTEGGVVKLKIHQEASSVEDTTNASGIITNERSIDSTVLVDDGQIVVLGGLMQDKVSEGRDRVPGLSRLPVIGGLFRADNRSRSKTNLMVFLRPYVLRTGEAANHLTQDRYDYIRNEQATGAMRPYGPLPDYPQPRLAPMAVVPAASIPDRGDGAPVIHLRRVPAGDAR